MDLMVLHNKDLHMVPQLAVKVVPTVQVVPPVQVVPTVQFLHILIVKLVLTHNTCHPITQCIMGLACILECHRDHLIRVCLHTRACSMVHEECHLQVRPDPWDLRV